jgi:hypothetical protein
MAMASAAALAAAKACHDARAALARHLPDPAVAAAEDALAIGLATLGSRPHRPVRASTPGLSCGSAGPETSRDPDD